MRKFCLGEVNFQRIGYNAQVITREDLSFDVCLAKVENSLAHCVATRQGFLQVNWRDFNLAYLKHNLSLKMYL
jgi:hypothetical protein